jgi:hypothetical protein
MSNRINSRRGTIETDFIDPHQAASPRNRATSPRSCIAKAGRRGNGSAFTECGTSPSAYGFQRHSNGSSVFDVVQPG